MSRLSKWIRERRNPLFVRGMELHIINHCNLTCRGCNHSAPALPKEVLTIDALRRQLALFRKVARCGVLRVIGGEPLMHPDLDDLLAVLRESGLFTHINIVTNGSLIHKMSDRFWELIDKVVLSKYPGVKVVVPPGREAKVETTEIPTFNEVYSTVRNDDDALVRKIWDECWMKDTCAGIIDGRFHRCMRGGYISKVVGLPPELDSLPLEGITKKAIWNLTRSEEPLAACAHCTGNNGRAFDHAMVPQKVWLTFQSRPIAEMVEFKGQGRPRPIPEGESVVVRGPW